MKESFQLTGRQPNFRRPRSSNSIILLVLLILVTGSVFVLRGVFSKEIKSPFEDTPIPTRTSSSYALEGETQFNAGNMIAAIDAYKKATLDDPKNVQLWSELARIQAYSSATLSTDADRRNRLQEALTSINTAVGLADDDSMAHAIKSFVLDWSANPVLAGDQSQQLFTQGEQEALRALQLDANNTLAYAYYAEILVDQQKWDQAEKEIQIALDKNEPLMDVYRVNAVVQESLGNYNEAIKQYQKAVDITPNLTFLYVYIGYNYRVLRQLDVALDYFTKAVVINNRLNLADPIPYMAIGKTYVDKGEFFAAALNVRAALNRNPDNPDVYGSLGLVYFKSRNYEGSIPALKCAVTGCDAQTSCEVRAGDVCKDSATSPAHVITGLPLSANTVVYYYTYASVLAAMDQPSAPRCQDAIPIMQQIRQGFANDDTIMSIIKPSEQICAKSQTGN